VDIYAIASSLRDGLRSGSRPGKGAEAGRVWGPGACRADGAGWADGAEAAEMCRANGVGEDAAGRAYGAGPGRVDGAEVGRVVLMGRRRAGPMGRG
jgi:hypothetical protein